MLAGGGRDGLLIDSLLSGTAETPSESRSRSTNWSMRDLVP